MRKLNNIAILKSIKTWLFALFINLMLAGIRIYMCLWFLLAAVETGYQLLDFLFSGEWHSTSLLARFGAVSDTQLLGWSKMMNWFYDLHVIFAFMFILLASLIGEFFLAKFIRQDRRWGNDEAFFSSRK